MLSRILLALVLLYGLYEGYGVIKDKFESVKELEYRITTTPISDVLQHPYSYDRDITISGRVRRSVNLFGIRCYRIADLNNPEAEILVIPQQPIVPREGAIVRVTGTVQQLVKIGNKEIVAFRATESSL
jgi:hypothetical protein